MLDSNSKTVTDQNKRWTAFLCEEFNLAKEAGQTPGEFFLRNLGRVMAYYTIHFRNLPRKDRAAALRVLNELVDEAYRASSFQLLNDKEGKKE